MKQRVCILRSNPVKPDSRVEKEAWTLKKAGYDVQILAWDRDSDHPEIKGKIKVASEEIPITWLGFKASFNAGMKSLRAYLKFQFAMCRWLHNHRGEIDIIHACDFDTAFFSQNFVCRKKFIFDIFDFLYGEPRNLLEWMVRKAQFWIINHADATIICTEERREQIADAHPKNLAVIHNTPFKSQLDGGSGLVFKSGSDRIKIAYVGILADQRMLSTIGKVISRHPEVELHIGGFGTLEPLFQELSAEYDNIFYYGRIPYSQTLELENKCDIMTAIYNPLVENCRRAAPNKFYESLMLGKPVMMVRETGMSKVVEQNNIGELIEFSESGFEQGLLRLISRQDEWPAMGERMKELYDASYSWDEMAKRLVDLYKRVNE